MIRAKCSVDPKKSTIRILLRGHANAGPRGKDLVCAGVSTLALTAANVAGLLHRAGLLWCRPRITLRPGYAEILATPKVDHEAEVLMAFWTVQAGLHVLAENYPQYIRLELAMQV